MCPHFSHNTQIPFQPNNAQTTIGTHPDTCLDAHYHTVGRLATHKMHKRATHWPFSKHTHTHSRTDCITATIMVRNTHRHSFTTCLRLHRKQTLFCLHLFILNLLSAGLNRQHVLHNILTDEKIHQWPSLMGLKRPKMVTLKEKLIIKQLNKDILTVSQSCRWIHNHFAMTFKRSWRCWKV